MNYTLKTKDVKESTLISDNSTFIDVEFDILDGKKVIETRKLGFAIGTPEKEIKAELEKFITLYNNEVDAAIVDKESQKLKSDSEKTITNLKEIEIHASTKTSTKVRGKR